MTVAVLLISLFLATLLLGLPVMLGVYRSEHPKFRSSLGANPNPPAAEGGTHLAGPLAADPPSAQSPGASHLRLVDNFEPIDKRPSFDGAIDRMLKALDFMDDPEAGDR